MTAAITEDIHEATVGELDRLITSAYEAKEQYLLKRYEEAAGYLDDVSAARKKAAALIHEMGVTTKMRIQEQLPDPSNTPGVDETAEEARMAATAWARLYQGAQQQIQALQAEVDYLQGRVRQAGENQDVAYSEIVDLKKELADAKLRIDVYEPGARNYTAQRLRADRAEAACAAAKARERAVPPT